MPKKYPPGSKRDVVIVALWGDLSIPEVAADIGISEESVRRWKRQADIDDGVAEGQISSEKSEIVQLRREKRRLNWGTRSCAGRRPISLSASLPR